MLFEYLREVTNHSDISSFSVTTNSLKGFEVMVRAAQDTNKPELCRSSRATLQALFSLNCATYSSLSDNMATSDRVLLTSLMRIECESPTGEQKFSPGSDVALGKLLKGVKIVLFIAHVDVLGIGMMLKQTNEQTNNCLFISVLLFTHRLQHRSGQESE